MATSTMTAAAALRDFLLAAERSTKQPLDAAVQGFAAAVERDARVLSALLDVSPQAEPVVHIWPDESGKETRWEDRESIAVYLEIVAKLLHAQTHERDARTAAEAMALKIVREKSGNLEKLLSWSDKPIIEFRVLELMAAIAGVSAVAARELVRIFNFQSPAFVKIAGRRMKKTAVQPVQDDLAEDEGEPAVSNTTKSSTASAAAVAAAPAFQIRAAYVRFVAALAACPDKSVHRFALKDGGVVASLFKSLDGDDSEMLATVMSHLDALVLRNENVDARGRTAIFNNAAVQQLLAVVKSDDEDAAAQAWTMVAKLFFEDGALYQLPARQSLRLFVVKSSGSAASAADATALIGLDVPTTTAIDSNSENTNAAVKVIRNVIGSIGLNDYIRSERVRSLVAKFLLEYPGLVAEFLSILSPQLEPKTGYRWFCVTAMLQNVLSVSLDAVVPDLQASAIDATGRYSAQTLASRLVMPLSCRKELSRGLQHTNNLVIYSSLGLIECALRRFQFVQSHLPVSLSSSDLENEFRFLLPSPETLVSLLMKLCTSVDSVALVYLRALTVFRLYLECLPLAMSEVKADFTKLLAWQFLEGNDSNTSLALSGVIAGEVLRVLMVVDESRLRYVVTSGGSDEVSKLSQLLRLHSASSNGSGDAVQLLARGVLFRVLAALKVFGSEGETSSPTEEIGVWLDNLATGGLDATAFVETIVQDLMADPFAFLSSSIDATTSPSPATLALVAALTGAWPVARSTAKMEASRQHQTVAAFASRVLLSLLCRSAEPTILAHLICADDARVALGGDDEQDAKRSTKKRRRSGSIDLASMTPLKCLQIIAQRVASPSSSHCVKSSAAPGGEWKPTKKLSGFGDALFALDATSFVEQFPKIVHDILRMGLPFTWLHQYIGARPDVDLLALHDVVLAASKKDKQLGPVLRDVVEVLPLNLYSQGILFSLATGSQQGDALENLVKQLSLRLETGGHAQQLDVIAVVAEQLLNCIQLVRNAESATLISALADVFLRLQVILSASESDVTSASVSLATKRLRLKLKSMTSSSALQSKLAGMDMIAQSLGASDAVCGDVDSLRLRQKGGAVTTILLAKRLPVVLRLYMLERLLAVRSATVKDSRQMPLVALLLQTLDHASSVSGFASQKRLTRLLWQALMGYADVDDDKKLRVLSAGLHIIGCLGGVTQEELRKSIPSTWSRVLVENFGTQEVDSNEKLFEDRVIFVRRLGAAIRSSDLVSGESSALEELIRLVLQQTQKLGGCAHLLAIAGALVATHGTVESLEVQKHATKAKLIEQAIQIAMESNPSATLPTFVGLVVLRHLALSGSVSPASQFKTLHTVLSSGKSNIFTIPQALSLLLTLRGGPTLGCEWPTELAVHLVRSAVAYACAGSTEIESAESSLQSIFLMARDLLSCAPSPSAIQSVLAKVAVDIKRLLSLEVESEAAAYHRFVRASRVIIRLIALQPTASVKGYDLRAHFEQLTSHQLFPASLSDPEINVELLRLVAAMLRLGSADMYNRTVFQHLLGAYDVSLSLSDRMIRSLLDDFESKAGILASQYGYRFGHSCLVLSSQKQDGSARSDLIEDSAWLLGGGLEPTRLRATIEWFPLNREVSVKRDSRLLLEDDERREEEEEDGCEDVEDDARAVVYDPSYLLPMLSRFVASSALTETAIIQQGILGVAIRAISSNADDVREFAYGLLAHVHEALSADAAPDFKPGRQVHLMLDTLRNALQEPLEGVSSAITVFMNDAISILCRPGHTMYPHVNQFLLARPALDLSDVPMFYSLFNSHSPQTYKQERSWLLHGLRRGVREDADVSLLIRRHVPSILLSFFGSDLADDHTQLLVCSILAAMLKTETGATYLLTKCAFFEWLTARFHDATASGASLGVVQALLAVLEACLKTELWNHVDTAQRLALGSGAVNCFEAAVAAVSRRPLVQASASRGLVARIALLLLERAYSACSLSTFTTVLTTVADGDNSTAMACADQLVSMRLLTHPEFQKSRFAEWGSLLSRVARVLALELRVLIGETCGPASVVSSPNVGHEARAHDALQRLRTVLMEAPTLKTLVLQQLRDSLATAALLM